MDEEILILDLKEGNISAFNKIFLLYHKRIYNFCRHLYQSPDKAKDTAQSVFIALWEQRKQMDEKQSLAPYLYSIARYMVYHEFRQQVNNQAVFNHFISNPKDLNESTKDEVIYNELLSFLESVIESLPERQREIFRLSRFSGLKYKQIAARLNITENTVDTQIRRALEFIQNKYRYHYMGK